MKSNYQKRTDQAESIRVEIEQSPYPVLVCGDFNVTPASYIPSDSKKFGRWFLRL